MTREAVETLTVEIGILIAVIGCFVGLAGWLAGRDKKIASDAEWKGTINAKLDVIVGISKDVDSLENKVQEHGERIKAVEESTKQAHLRINEHISGH